MEKKHIGSRSCEFPSPDSEKSANVGPEGRETVSGKMQLQGTGVTMSNIVYFGKGLQGFTMVAYNPRLWLMAA
eukprot:1138156-Pelagomonas_calceolata.AAC.9